MKDSDIQQLVDNIYKLAHLEKGSVGFLEVVDTLPKETLIKLLTYIYLKLTRLNQK